MADVDQSRTVRFGLFEVDLRTHELRKNGIKINLQEQPFQVLISLLRHANDVVTREELRRELWPEDTFVDFDHSLNAAIKRLRDALGESAENPVFIETLARRGYRFIAPVSMHPVSLAVGTQAPRSTTIPVKGLTIGAFWVGSPLPHLPCSSVSRGSGRFSKGLQDAKAGSHPYLSYRSKTFRETRNRSTSRMG
jgi:DNA-binding winged helix-turn-helix (wHTH) protein